MKPLTRTQWTILAAGIGTIVLVLLVVWLVDRRRASDRVSVNVSGEMAGMPGMSMPASGIIELTTSQITQFGVTFGFVEQRMLTTELRVPGTVVVDETRVAQVALKFGGFVERLHANVTGQYVRAGQPLMEVYSPEVFAAMQELLVASRLERTSGGAAVPGVTQAATDLVAASRRRLELLGVAGSDVEATLRRGEAARTVTVYSPASGIVTERLVVQGQAVQAGQTLYTISDLSGIWVNADVRETDAALLRAGLGADVELASMPGRPFKGMVTYVYPTLNPQTRTVTARVSVANAGGQLRPGMFATVHLRSPTRRALTVPTSALVRTGERTLVFVDMGAGRFTAQVVEIGQSTSEYTEVLSGLEPGQRVVTSAQFLLDSESNLAEVMRSMIGQGSAAMTDMKGMPGMDMGGKPTDKGAKVRP
jgi:Cu(I)/Ag(I) efflux system membrane fusion protein